MRKIEFHFDERNLEKLREIQQQATFKSDFDPKAEIDRMGVSFHELDEFLQFMNSFCEMASRVVVCGLPRSGKSVVVSYLQHVKWKQGPPTIQERTLNRQATKPKISDLIWHMPNREDVLMADVILIAKKVAGQFWVQCDKCRWVSPDNLKKKEWRVR